VSWVVGPGQDQGRDVDLVELGGRGEVGGGRAAQQRWQKGVGHGEFGVRRVGHGRDDRGGKPELHEGVDALALDQVGVAEVDRALGHAGFPGGRRHGKGEAGEAIGLAQGGVDQRGGAHRWADAVDLLPRGDVLEQTHQIVGELGPAVGERIGGTGGEAVAAGVVAQHAMLAQGAGEVEAELFVTHPAGGQAVELNDQWTGVARDVVIEGSIVEDKRGQSGFR
jgi:hypothetical protein